MSWFTQGNEHVERRAKEVEEALNKDYLPDFFLNPDQEAIMSFVTTEPFNFYQHYLQSTKKYFTCSQDGSCVLCSSGNKATFSSAYLVTDHRYETWQDKKDGSKKERQNTLKLAKFGIRAAKTLSALNKKRGLGSYAWDVTRTGSGNDTAYTFIPSMDAEMVPIPKIIPEMKKTTHELLMEALAPKSREQLLRVLSGTGVAVGQAPATGGGQPQARPNLDLSDEGQDPDTISWAQ